MQRLIDFVEERQARGRGGLRHEAHGDDADARDREGRQQFVEVEEPAACVPPHERRRAAGKVFAIAILMRGKELGWREMWRAARSSQ